MFVEVEAVCTELQYVILINVHSRVCGFKMNHERERKIVNFMTKLERRG